MMENLVKIRIEKLDEGGYLATSEDFEDLMAQGETIEETLEIAQDVARS
jgi:predicted RNase H-like HicB family nuclease